MERQHQGIDRPGVRQVPEGSGEQREMEETGCEVICGAQTTLAVKGKVEAVKLPHWILADCHQIGKKGGFCGPNLQERLKKKKKKKKALTCVCCNIL